MRFTIEFHGPFRVGTGESARGSDDAIDIDNPLPASGIKGAMRAVATGLGVDQDLVGEVYGTAANGSPWAWVSGHDWQWSKGLATPEPQQRIRIRIDDSTGTVEEGGLFNVEALWPIKCVFDIDQIGHIEPDRKELHVAVLRNSARAVHSLGADRTRGFGWVTVSPERATDTDVRHDMTLMGLL